MPLISVIIPVYNAQEHLRECLDTVLKQSLSDLEILCVNDGSTDGSPQILQAYAQRDSRVRVLSQRNLNAGAARNLGMQYATGKYFSFLDADDFFEPQMLEKAYRKAEETQAEVLLFGSDSFFQDSGSYGWEKLSQLKSMLPAKEVFAGREVHNLFCAIIGWPWDKLFKAEYIRENGLRFQEQRTSNDLLFVYAAAAKASRISLVEETLAHHRRTEKDSLSTTREKSWHCFYDALLALRAQLIKWELFDHYERDFINYCVEAARWNLDTLSQPIKDVLTYMLGRAWFAQLGVADAPEEAFYRLEDYMLYQRIKRDAQRLCAQECTLGSGTLQVLAENEQIKHSASYRIGRAVTWLPRKLRGGLRCLREHGPGYTLRLALAKLRRGRRGE